MYIDNNGKEHPFIYPAKKTQRSSVTAMNWRNFIQIEKTI